MKIKNYKFTINFIHIANIQIKIIVFLSNMSMAYHQQISINKNIPMLIS
jgi:hypothetical protein